MNNELGKIWFSILILLLISPGMASPEYSVQSAYESPNPPLSLFCVIPDEIPVWELPIGIFILLIGVYIVEILFFLKIWAMFGYRRVTQSNVLDHAARLSVFQVIQKNPGIHMQSLARETKIHLGTLRHHLHMLTKTGKITCCQDTATIQYYENNGKYTETQKLVLKHLRNTTRNQILNLLKNQPSFGRDEIARQLGVTGATITWHMKLLEADRLIQVQRNGRNVLYLPSEALSRCLND